MVFPQHRAGRPSDARLRCHLIGRRRVIEPRPRRPRPIRLRVEGSGTSDAPTISQVSYQLTSEKAVTAQAASAPVERIEKARVPTEADASFRFPREPTIYMPMALWASLMCFIHPASSPFFILAFDVSMRSQANFLL